MGNNENFRVEDNYGRDGSTNWAGMVGPDGVIKDRPIFLGIGERWSGEGGTGLSVQDAEDLIDELANAVYGIKTAQRARLDALAEEAEAERKRNALPTEKGLYVHPRFAQDVEQTFTAAIYKLNDEGWREITATAASAQRTEEEMRAIRERWGGLAPLRAVAAEEK